MITKDWYGQTARGTKFLGRTFEIVPSGEETGHIDFDTELANLLNQA